MSSVLLNPVGRLQTIINDLKSKCPNPNSLGVKIIDPFAKETNPTLIPNSEECNKLFAQMVVVQAAMKSEYVSTSGLKDITKSIEAVIKDKSLLSLKTLEMITSLAGPFLIPDEKRPSATKGEEKKSSSSKCCQDPKEHIFRLLRKNTDSSFDKARLHALDLQPPAYRAEIMYGMIQSELKDGYSKYAERIRDDLAFDPNTQMNANALIAVASVRTKEKKEKVQAFAKAHHLVQKLPEDKKFIKVWWEVITTFFENKKKENKGFELVSKIPPSLKKEVLADVISSLLKSNSSLKTILELSKHLNDDLFFIQTMKNHLDNLDKESLDKFLENFFSLCLEGKYLNYIGNGIAFLERFSTPSLKDKTLKALGNFYLTIPNDPFNTRIAELFSKDELRNVFLSDLERLNGNLERALDAAEKIESENVKLQALHNIAHEAIRTHQYPLVERAVKQIKDPVLKGILKEYAALERLKEVPDLANPLKELMDTKLEYKRLLDELNKRIKDEKYKVHEFMDSVMIRSTCKCTKIELSQHLRKKISETYDKLKEKRRNFKKFQKKIGSDHERYLQYVRFPQQSAFEDEMAEKAYDKAEDVADCIDNEEAQTRAYKAIHASYVMTGNPQKADAIARKALLDLDEEEEEKA